MVDMQRRNVLKAVGGAGILLTAGVGTAAARNGQRQGASGDQTIFEIADGSDDFDILELALEETGLDDVLDAKGKQYTVFAPTDAAFQALIDTPGDAIEDAGDLLALPNLADILLYHVTKGRRYSQSWSTHRKSGCSTATTSWSMGRTSTTDRLRFKRPAV
ncbi:fasciclin domain-containing protein [Halomicroarcula sp. GCM10025817]|uniref:fasciclin domain-containing protein n=1 Tax=Haloarcula TaxID=2237 RepID=UPI0023E87117|nr:fasciclin domain-containing protein [Halomicroarcula sp. SYNS111]